MTDVTLSPREAAVLVGLSYGHTYAAIGAELGISEETAKSHARRLFRKLGVVDRAHAVRVGFELGLLTPYVRPVPDLVPQPTVPGFKDRHIGACFAAEACPCRQAVAS